MGTRYENKKGEQVMNCFFCKGDMKDGFTTHVTELKNCIVIIKNVPCLKCEQCGEVVYSGEVLKQLDEIIDHLETGLTEIAVINYPNRVA